MKYCIAGLIWDVRIFDILCIGEIIVANQAHFNGYGYFTGVSTCTTLFYQYRWKSGVRAFANNVVVREILHIMRKPDINNDVFKLDRIPFFK